MSSRVMELLTEFCPEIEVYSIDEAFLRIDSFNLLNIDNYVKEIFFKIKQYTGIPTSIGIGSTKTLAKVANRIAKKGSGIFSILCPKVQEDILDSFNVEDIWGIGKKFSIKLRLLGIGTAKQLREAPAKLIRKNFSVAGERILYELNGIPCLELEMLQEPRKNIVCSKSFGNPIRNIDTLEEALSNYIAHACFKLRRQKSVSQGICVFITTNYFKPNEPQYSNSIASPLLFPTSDTRIIITSAKKLLKKIFKSNFSYKKVGIMLLDITKEEVPQQVLFFESRPKNGQKIMEIIDLVNGEMGKNTLKFAAQGIDNSWQMRCDKRSPRYSTRYDELAKAYCIN